MCPSSQALLHFSESSCVLSSANATGRGEEEGMGWGFSMDSPLLAASLDLAPAENEIAL